MIITKELLKASIPCCGVKDVRYYLNGALFSYRSATKRLEVISTNGPMLSRFIADYPEETAPDFDIIIPIDTLKAAVKALDKSPAVALERIDDKRWALDLQLFSPIDGKYPDWQRVNPDRGWFKEDSPAGQFNPDLQVDARAALRAYYDAKDTDYKLHHRGPTDSALMAKSLADECFVVIMPMLF
jgi:hypothetical protein